jgi:predicted transposase YdaD
LTERSTIMGREELLLDQAEKKGELSKAKNIARAMKNDGVPIAQIAKFTGLSIDEIEKL